jgi:hypothetical protein
VNRKYLPENAERYFAILNMHLRVACNAIHYWNNLAGVAVSRVTMFRRVIGVNRTGIYV